VRKDCTVGKLSECNEACDEVKDPQMKLELHLRSQSCTATTRVACAKSGAAQPQLELACVKSEIGGPLFHRCKHGSSLAWPYTYCGLLHHQFSVFLGTVTHIIYKAGIVATFYLHNFPSLLTHNAPQKGCLWLKASQA
jgi:hypothetical protein